MARADPHAQRQGTDREAHRRHQQRRLAIAPRVDLPGRRDLECVLELTAFMRASREVEPPPPMRADLLGLLGEPPSPS